MPVFMNRIRPIARRVRRLTTRQNIALAASALLGVAIVASAASGWQSLATALIGLTTMLALLASIQLRRRLAQNGRNLNVQMNDLAKRFDVAQRRILASIENERLMGADRQSVLEGGQRRLIAALENERLAAAERQRQLENQQRTLLSRLSETQDSVEHAINRSALKSVENIAAEHRR